MSVTAKLIADAADSRDDFGFELRVRGLLNSAQLATLTHGESYYDPNTGKQRQSDFRFRLVNNATRCIQLGLECKNFHLHEPMVISGVKRPVSELTHFAVVASGWLPGGTFFIVPVQNESMYPVDSFTGKSARQYSYSPERTEGRGNATKLIPESMTAGKDEEFFAKMSQSLTSSYDLLVEASQLGKMGASLLASITLPVLVVPNDTLWVLRYDDTGRRTGEPERVDQCDYYVGHEYGIPAMNGGIGRIPCRIPHMHIMTMSGLESFLAQISDFENPLWDKWFEGALTDRKY